ncbi:uncharacterized protein [Haliotis cracherodii]|uniref:uncharacterized protein isoform X2 n=1 Tax=Haliotis cracherodii TaxID=6455 RepID=UPI0039E838FF
MKSDHVGSTGLITQLTERMKEVVLGLYLILASCAVVLLVPVPAGRHFFVFWKTASSHLIPRTEHAHHNIKELLLDYYRSGVVNVTSGGRLESANELYRSLNLSKFPSQGVLKREGKKPFFFIKGLLKEDYRMCEVFSRVLSYEEDFRCNNITDQLSEYICARMKGIAHTVKHISRSLLQQLTDFFHVPDINIAKPSQLERRLKAELIRKMNADERKMKKMELVSDNDYYDGDVTEVDEMDASRTMSYRKRNQASVAILYAAFLHLQDTESSLRYALRVLEPPRDAPTF